MTSAQCGYDALGRRIEARSFADGQLDAVRRYWYNDQWQVLTQGLWSQAYAGLALSRNYIYGNTIDEVLGFEWVVDGTPGMRYYYLHDHLYSPAAMLTEWGIVERYEYDAYGRRSVMSAGFAHRNNSHYLSDLGLTGREIDELDLDAAAAPRLQHMHYRHRDYSPQLGRFMQHDPLGISIRAAWLGYPFLIGDPGPTADYNIGGNSVGIVAHMQGIYTTSALPFKDYFLVPNHRNFQSKNQYSDGINLYEHLSSKPTIGFDSFGLLKAPSLFSAISLPPFADAWKNPDDAICDRHSGPAEKACKAFVNGLLKCFESGRRNACATAGRACQYTCGTDYMNEVVPMRWTETPLS